jgi:spore maturation protein CgeB
MKFVVFGLTVSSAWGNGHATLWRGLCRALASRGHRVVFFEKDVPYYASTRDLDALPRGRLILYESFEQARPLAKAELAGADVAIVTSYCPDGVVASELCLESNVACKVFYDLDTPVTLATLEQGEHPSYIGKAGLGDFDLVLSFTGGAALDELKTQLGARRVAALYGHVDPTVHRPEMPGERYRASLSYLGTYAVDRQSRVEELFLSPARKFSDQRFVLGGPMYPDTDAFPSSVAYFPHVTPHEHPAFFCSSKLTLSVTRSAMARLGYCPSGRLFEASACGVPIASDWFEGLDQFFELGRELLVVRSAEDVLEALELGDELRTVARRGRERTLSEHTAERRVLELERLLGEVASHVDVEA